MAAYSDAIQCYPNTRVFEGRTSPEGPKRHPFEGAPINLTGGNLWSCNMAVSSNLFREIGGFNEAFPYAAMEDMDFRERLNQFGVGYEFVPKAEIIHPWRMLDVKRHTRLHVASQLIYARLHPGQRHVVSLWRLCKLTARYYMREFPQELRAFGLLALRCQPIRWWEILYRGWHFSVNPKPTDLLDGKDES
jgi:GT2 family glycosyltransferase